MNTEVTTLVFGLKELCLQKLFGILKLFTVSPQEAMCVDSLLFSLKRKYNERLK